MQVVCSGIGLGGPLTPLEDAPPTGRDLAADESQGCPHRQEKGLRATEQRLKLVLPVEGGGVLINGIGTDGMDPDQGFDDAMDGVIEEQAADPCRSKGKVPAHPADQDDGNAWITGQFPGQFRGEIVQQNAVRGQGVEARDLARAALDQEIAGCIAALDVLGNGLVEIPINVLIPAGEARALVFGEGF